MGNVTTVQPRLPSVTWRSIPLAQSLVQGRACDIKITKGRPLGLTGSFAVITNILSSSVAQNSEHLLFIHVTHQQINVGFGPLCIFSFLDPGQWSSLCKGYGWSHDTREKQEGWQKPVMSLKAIKLMFVTDIHCSLSFQGLKHITWPSSKPMKWDAGLSHERPGESHGNG